MRPQIRLLGTLTPTVTWLLGINVALFVLQNVFGPLPQGPVTEALGLFPGRVWPYYTHTLITYAFLHGSVGHLLFNMLTLYFFAGDLDLFLGRRRFLALYLGSALAGGLAAALFLPGPAVVLGASGALYGVLTAFAVYFPTTQVLLWFVVPVNIRLLAAIWIGVSLFYSVFGSGESIAHLAHLGGAVFALLFVYRAWRPASFLRDLRYRWKRRRFTRIQ